MNSILRFLQNLFTRAARASEAASLPVQSSEKAIEAKSSKPIHHFSPLSKNRLSQCHPKLQELCHAILQEIDIAVICGYRGEVEQNKAFAEKKSKLKYPKSKHNQIPSRAVDIVPMPLDWNNIAAFERMCLIAEEKAKELRIPIRLGRDFSFRDFPHVELI
jgi:peptidoglycan L-alanyl-D-glutamate endopeptidase CwlK